jgi:hypothetical protein
MKYTSVILFSLLSFTSTAMPKQISSRIVINATPQKVWSVLTDFSHYPEWNTFIVSVTGDPAPGSTLKIRLQPPEASGMTIKPVVLLNNEHKLFRWKGKLLIKGLFDGEHSFELEDNGDGTTTFIHYETFTGILVPIFKKLLDVHTLNGFRQMNEQLKKRSEA